MGGRHAAKVVGNGTQTYDTPSGIRAYVVCAIVRGPVGQQAPQYPHCYCTNVVKWSNLYYYFFYQTDFKVS